MMPQPPESPAADVWCPWQLSKHPYQERLCCKLLTFQLLYECHFGPMKVDCMGEHCEVWQAFKRMQELLRQWQEEKAEDVTRRFQAQYGLGPRTPPANPDEAKPDKPIDKNSLPR